MSGIWGLAHSHFSFFSFLILLGFGLAALFFAVVVSVFRGFFLLTHPLHVPSRIDRGELPVGRYE